MDNQTFLKILKDSKKGNFTTAFQLLSENVELDQHSAAKIVIECCRKFAKNNIEITHQNLENLSLLLKRCAQFLKDMDDNLAQNYFKSIFLIFKYIFNHEQYDWALQTKSLLLPEFLQSSIYNEAKSFYVYLCDLVYNTIVNVDKNKKSDIIYDKLVELSLNMNVINNINGESLVKLASTYFKTASFMKLDSEIQYSRYAQVLNILERQNISLCTVLKIIETFTVIQIKASRWETLSKGMKETKRILQPIFKEEKQSKLFHLVNSVYELILTLSGTSECLDNYCFEECCNGFNYFCVKFGLSNELHEVCKVTNLIFYKSIQCNLSAISSNLIHEAETLIVFKFLFGIGKIFSQIKVQCSVCSTCDVKSDLYTSVCITILIGKLLKELIKNFPEISKTTLNISFNYLDFCCQNINNMKSKNCQQWRILWNEVGVTIYNIGVKLYSLKRREAYKYIILLLKNVICLEGFKSSTFDFDVISSSLNCLSETCMQFNQHNSALMFAAFGIYSNDKNIEVYKQWIRVKSKCKEIDSENSQIQEQTIVGILKQNEIQIKKFYSDFKADFSNDDMINFIKLELEYYKVFWPSKIPMYSAFKSLYEIADLMISVEVLVKIWGIHSGDIHDFFATCLEDCLCKLEQCKNIDALDQIYLAYLNTAQYCCKIKKARKNIINEIKKAETFEEKGLLPHEMPKNPNDTCDLFSNYTSLKLEIHLNITKYLNKSLALFSACIYSNNLSPNTKNLLKELNALSILTTIAYELQLECFSIQFTETCFLCLRLSQIFEEKRQTLKIVSLLLEDKNIDFNAEHLSAIIKECESIASEMDELSTVDNLNSLILYYISKSQILLRHQVFDLGYEEYQKANNYFLKLTEDNPDYKFIKLKLDFLHIQYLQLPCKFKIEGHQDYSLGKLLTVSSEARHLFKSKGWELPHFTFFLLDMHLLIANMYKSMQLPREVRRHSTDIVALTQKLILPLKTANFLVHLTQADLLNYRLEDAEMKLKSLENILCLAHNSSHNESKSINKNTQESIDTEDLIEGFQNISLNPKEIIGSPILYQPKSLFPSFIKHATRCDCFYCSNVEYKNLVILYMLLEAQFHICSNNFKEAQIYFQTGSKIYNKMIKSIQINVLIQQNSQFSFNPFHKLEHLLWETNFTLTLHYGNWFLKTKDIVKAEVINKELMLSIYDKRLKNMYLYNQVLFQNLLIQMSQFEQNVIKKNSVEDNEPVTSNEDKIVTTPKNKQSSIVYKLSPISVTKPATKRGIGKQCYLFKDEGNENNEVVNNVSEIQQSSELKMFSVKQETKTPNVNINTYEPATLKTLKRLALKEISPSKSNEDSNNFLIPMSPNAYSSNCLKAINSVNSRTKKLTEKLKKERVQRHETNDKVEVFIGLNNADQDGENVSKSDKLRKNLISDFCAADQNGHQTKNIVKKSLLPKKIKEKQEVTETTRVTRSSKLKTET